MGASTSVNKIPRQEKTKELKRSQTFSHYIKNSVRSLKYKRNLKWQSNLRRIIINSKGPDPKWTSITKALLHYVNSKKKEINNHMSTHNDLVNSVIQANHSIPFQQQQFDYQDSQDFLSSYNPTILMNFKSLIRLSQIEKQKKIDTQHLVFESSSSSPIREELRTILLILIKLGNRTLKELFHEFHDIFRKCFEEEIQLLEIMSDHERENTLTEAIATIKCFAKIAETFLKWTYQDILDHYSPKLRNEEGGLFTPNYIISSIVYRLLFKNKKAPLNVFLDLLLSRQYSPQRVEFKNAIEDLQNIDLSREGYVASNFALPSTLAASLPYETTIQKIKDLKNCFDPYSKFELIVSLESSLFKSVRDYYQGNFEKERKIREQWESDVKLPLLVYCIIKSKNNASFIDTKFIESFIHRRYWDIKTPNFIRFEIAINAILDKLY